MVAELRRFPEYRVTLLRFSGAVDIDETVELFRALDERDRDCRITYFSEDVDLVGLAVETPHLKRALAEKQKQLAGGRHALVCRSKAAREYMDFLRRYTAVGDVHPTIPKAFSDLKAACDWLGLPDEARQALAEAADASLGDRGRRDTAGPPGVAVERPAERS